MELISTQINVRTKGFNDIIDITASLQETLAESRLDEGSMLVFVGGSTAGITTMEFEEGLEQDLRDCLERLIPAAGNYLHNQRWHDGNGYAHLRAALLKPSLVIPFAEKRLCLGTWQQVVLVDFDNRPRDRKLVIQLSGKLRQPPGQ